MDFRRLPSCTEVSSWTPEALIDYFKRCDLKDCQKLVKKQGISGKRFLEMSENDMQKFPKITVPILIRIQQEINKKEEKKRMFTIRPETQKGHLIGKMQGSHTPGSYNPNTLENYNCSESDSFEDDDDDDYEHPEDDSDYESPTAGDEDDNISDPDYEPPPSSIESCPINPPKSNIGDPDYVDRPVLGNYHTCPPDPPTRDISDPPSVLVCPARGRTFPGAQPSSQENHRIAKPLHQKSNETPPVVLRNTKPVIHKYSGTPASGKYQKEQTNSATLPVRLRQQVPVKPDAIRKPPLPNHPSIVKQNYMRHNADDEDNSANGVDDPQRLFLHRPYNSNTFPSTSPKPSVKQMSSGSNTLPITDFSHSGPGIPYKPDNRFSEGNRSPAPIPGNSVSQHTTSGNDSVSSEQWYMGSISRKDAENALRSINQDGTFLVRNCSQSTTSQPYVLMVLYRTKVYNVRIRYDQKNQSYLLGSGGHETFGSVSDIIKFFRQTPLLLIDGKDRESRQHCKLTCIATQSFH